MRAEYNTNCQLVYALFYFWIEFSPIWLCLLSAVANYSRIYTISNTKNSVNPQLLSFIAHQRHQLLLIISLHHVFACLQYHL
uniref:Uncharacterized protein n=1 Tax=Aliivibrio wodanis TaxID=80852 RepID=A0A5Q4ZQS5_9GAMM|nr:hypothetical protein AW0309160_00531 [Aliivibrio wodanis]